MLPAQAQIVMFWGPEYVALYNDAYASSIGDKHPRALGRPARENWSELWDDLEPLLRRARSGETVVAKDRPFQIERRGYLEQVYFDISYSPARNAADEVEGVVCIVSETTERVLSERELRRANERYQLALSAGAAVGTWDWHIDSDRVYADESFARLYGVDPARAASGAPVAEFVAGIHPGDKERVAAAIAKAIKAGEGIELEYRVFGPEGTVRNLFVHGHSVRNSEGRTVRLPGVAVDITKLRSTEVALRETEARYSALFNSIDQGFCIIEFLDGPHGPMSDYVHVEANAAYAVHAGIENVVGRKVRDMVPDEADGWVRLYGEVLATGQPIRFERDLVATGRHLELAAFRVEPPTRRQVAVLFQDITARKSAETALRESEAQFRTFAQAMPNHVWTSPPNGLLDWFNDRVYEYSGLKHGELDGQQWVQIVHPDDVPAAAEGWARSLESGVGYEIEFRLRRADGIYRWHIARAVPILGPSGELARWIGTNTDVHDQKDLEAVLERRLQERTRELMLAEESLRQAQKMEAVGQLTGGIAHDFNNLLTGIIGSLDILRRRVSSRRLDDIDRFIDAATSSANRAAGLTQRLLAFSRRQSLDLQAVDIVELIVSMEELLRRTLGEQIELKFRHDGVWPASGDANQIENALLNFAINARDAMPDGGTLTIESDNISLPPGHAFQRDGLEPGDYVAMRVSDTGVGNPERGPRPRVRSVFHDQADRAGDRPGSLDGLWLRQAVARPPPYRKR